MYKNAQVRGNVDESNDIESPAGAGGRGGSTSSTASIADPNRDANANANGGRRKSSKKSSQNQMALCHYMHRLNASIGWGQAAPI